MGYLSQVKMRAVSILFFCSIGAAVAAAIDGQDIRVAAHHERLADSIERQQRQAARMRVPSYHLQSMIFFGRCLLTLTR